VSIFTLIPYICNNKNPTHTDSQMMQHIQITIQRDTGKRKILNALLAIMTGVLALIWPNFLYYIVGGYLLVLALILFLFRAPGFLTALSAITALLIFLFPELIPYTFAFFLAFFGITFLLLLKLIPLGILMLVFSLLILLNPASVAGMIAVFLLLYGAIHVINFLQELKRQG